MGILNYWSWLSGNIAFILIILNSLLSVNSLVSIYNLTPAEAQVAISMANGYSIEDVASTSENSAHTIRTHLKSVFKETGVTRQIDLIKLLLTSPFAYRKR